jgi:hypothetical protein
LTCMFWFAEYFLGFWEVEMEMENNCKWWSMIIKEESMIGRWGGGVFGEVEMKWEGAVGVGHFLSWKHKVALFQYCMRWWVKERRWWWCCIDQRGEFDISKVAF